MKKFINCAFLIVLLLAGYACNDGVANLDKEPLGKPSTSTLYTTEQGIHKLVNGAYAQMRSFVMSAFGRFVAKEVMSDDTNPGSTPADAGVMLQINNFTYLPTSGNLTGYYNGNYTLIARSNSVINNAPDADMGEQLKARYIGEAKFLRAFAYFNLVRGWGGVSIYKKAPADPREAAQVVPRSSKEEVYQLIISDLEDAISSLPLKSEYSSSDIGRATKGAARTLLAEVYLFQQDYENTLKYAMDVVDSQEYSLLDNYSQNWKVEYENGAESIFEVQFITRAQQDIGNVWTQFQGIRGNVGWGFFSPSKDLADAYEDNDPRRDATIFFEGEAYPGTENDVPIFADGTDPRANQKSLLPKPWPVGYPVNSPLNLVVIRYADVLLMVAEANNELNNTADALKYLEMIRARARQGDATILPEITTTDKVQLRHKIWKERRIELALEGYRYFDILRYNKVEPGFAKNLFDALGKTNFDPNKHTLFPIPQSEIDFSGGKLEQNPGW